MLAYVGNYLLAQIRSSVEHRHDDAAQLETLVRA
jgi:hypothetical protein